MTDQRLDFHRTFRLLTKFTPSLFAQTSQLESYISELLSNSVDQKLDKANATTQWMAWLDKFQERIESEKDLWDSPEDEREVEGKNANPRFVLRQWVLEEVIAKVAKDHSKGKRLLAKVLHVRSFSRPSLCLMPDRWFRWRAIRLKLGVQKVRTRTNWILRRRRKDASAGLVSRRCWASNVAVAAR